MHVDTDFGKGPSGRVPCVCAGLTIYSCANPNKVFEEGCLQVLDSVSQHQRHFGDAALDFVAGGIAVCVDCKFCDSVRFLGCVPACGGEVAILVHPVLSRFRTYFRTRCVGRVVQSLRALVYVAWT